MSGHLRSQCPQKPTGDGRPSSTERKYPYDRNSRSSEKKYHYQRGRQGSSSRSPSSHSRSSEDAKSSRRHSFPRSYSRYGKPDSDNVQPSEKSGSVLKDIPQEMLEKRYRDGLCLFCGESNHCVGSFPKLPKGLKMTYSRRATSSLKGEQSSKVRSPRPRSPTDHVRFKNVHRRPPTPTTVKSLSFGPDPVVAAKEGGEDFDSNIPPEEFIAMMRDFEALDWDALGPLSEMDTDPGSDQ